MTFHEVVKMQTNVAFPDQKSLFIVWSEYKCNINCMRNKFSALILTIYRFLFFEIQYIFLAKLYQFRGKSRKFASKYFFAKKFKRNLRFRKCNKATEFEAFLVYLLFDLSFRQFRGTV